jgi:hypothetical protein
MRIFVLHRQTDSAGVSGTGVVAEGVEFTDGVVVLRWVGLGRADTLLRSSTTIHDDIDAVEAVHGQGGDTTVLWLDEMEP